MRILQLKAARDWSTAQAAKVFAVTEDTIATWLRRTDEERDTALVKTTVPVNKFPVFVGYLVRWLKAMCPERGAADAPCDRGSAKVGKHASIAILKRFIRSPDLNGCCGLWNALFDRANQPIGPREDPWTSTLGALSG